MTLDDHNKLLAQLKLDEGFVPHVYEDGLGYYTIGYGRLVDQRKGGGITLGEAEYLLNNDLYKVIQQLGSFAWYSDQDSVRQSALADMGFNLGVENLVREWPHFIGHIAAKEYPQAVACQVGSAWHAEVGPRAVRIEKMIETGEWP